MNGIRLTYAIEATNHRDLISSSSSLDTFAVVALKFEADHFGWLSLQYTFQTLWLATLKFIRHALQSQRGSLMSRLPDASRWQASGNTAKSFVFKHL